MTATVSRQAFPAAVANLESTRAAAVASQKEYDRQKTLAEQNNVSARALEAARATATHDGMAFESTLAKFALDWGQSLANGADREKILAEVVNGQAALVRVDLPAGETLPSPPVSARIVAMLLIPRRKQQLQTSREPKADSH